MSLKNSQKYATAEERAARVLVLFGRAPNIAKGLNDKERDALAKLCDEHGHLADGAAEKFQAAMIAYADRLKATDEDNEKTPTPKGKE